RLAEAERPIRDALACYQQLAAEAPGELLYQEELARATNNLGVYYARSDQATEAVDTFTRTCVLYEKLVEAHPEVPDFRHMLASAYLQTGSAAAAHRCAGGGRRGGPPGPELAGKAGRDFPRNARLPARPGLDPGHLRRRAAAGRRPGRRSGPV